MDSLLDSGHQILVGFGDETQRYHNMFVVVFSPLDLGHRHFKRQADEDLSLTFPIHSEEGTEC